MGEGQPTNQFPNQTFMKRYKFMWRVFLISNFALGAYMFTQAGKREKGKEKGIEKGIEKEKEKEIQKEKSEPEVIPTPSVPEELVATPVPEVVQEEPIFSPPVTTPPVIIREPIPDNQQREIFKWILEEKRKIKPQNSEEKKRINEEKAILKDFIRSEFIPKI